MEEETKIGTKTGIVILIIFTIIMWNWMKGGNSKQPPKLSQESRELIWTEEGKSAVKARLKDPYSAKFRDVFFGNASGTPVVCGQVNSKNSLGGYTGYQYFIAHGPNTAVLQKEVKNFSKSWNKVCRK